LLLNAQILAHALGPIPQSRAMLVSCETVESLSELIGDCLHNLEVYLGQTDEVTVSQQVG
jgi:hypothetical protein